MSCAFPAELQQLVQDELATASYASEDEVLLEAMRACGAEKAFQEWRAEIQGRIHCLTAAKGSSWQMSSHRGHLPRKSRRRALLLWEHGNVATRCDVEFGGLCIVLW